MSMSKNKTLSMKNTLKKKLSYNKTPKQYVSKAIKKMATKSDK